ncbi:MAG: hypothetical protein PVF96_00790 [Candidatus Bathyarchaeota archaeon]
MDSGRGIVIASCWFSLTIIASVYMFVFGNRLGDVFFGVLIPIGLLVLAGIIVTFVLAKNSTK